MLNANRDWTLGRFRDTTRHIPIGFKPYARLLVRSQAALWSRSVIIQPEDKTSLECDRNSTVDLDVLLRKLTFFDFPICARALLPECHIPPGRCLTISRSATQAQKQGSGSRAITTSRTPKVRIPAPRAMLDPDVASYWLEKCSCKSTRLDKSTLTFRNVMSSSTWLDLDWWYRSLLSCHSLLPYSTPKTFLQCWQLPGKV